MNPDSYAWPALVRGRVKSAMANFSSSTATLASVPDERSPRQEWAVDDSYICNRPKQQGPTLQTLLHVQGSKWSSWTSPPTMTKSTSSSSKSSSKDPDRINPLDRQEYERRIERLELEVKFLNQKNAELEMNSIVTFGEMSRSSMCIQCENVMDLPISKPNPTKPSLLVSSSSFNNGPSVEAAAEITSLQQRLDRLEYVSRLWERYMFNLSLMQKQNKDLLEELEEYRREERRSRERPQRFFEH